MAKWRVDFRVDVPRGCHVSKDPGMAANGILRALRTLDPRPISAIYDDPRVEMSFVIDAENLSVAILQQSRIHDSLSKTIESCFGIEFDPPQEIEVGANRP